MPIFLLLLLLSACGGSSPPAPVPAPVTPERVLTLLATLAADSMEGRLTGSHGSARAATFIAGEMRAAGLVTAGDAGYLQRLPLVRGQNGRPTLAVDFPARDTFPATARFEGGNLIGILPGSDPALREEVVLVSAHYDHVGIRQPVNGDSIYNGADDNAFGVVTILEVARLLRQGVRQPPGSCTVQASSSSRAMRRPAAAASGSLNHIQSAVRHAGEDAPSRPLGRGAEAHGSSRFSPSGMKTLLQPRFSST